MFSNLKDVRRKFPDHVEELGKAGFKMDDSIESSNLHYEYAKKLGFQFTSLKNMKTYEEVTDYLRSKGTMVLPRFPGTDKKSMELDFPKYDLLLKFTKDDFFSDIFGFSTKPNHILFKIFRDEIQKLYETGNTINYDPIRVFYLKGRNDNIPVVHEADKAAKALTIDRLSAGFIIWLVSLFLTSLLLLAEIFIYHMSKCCQKMKLKRKSKKFKMSTEITPFEIV